MKRILNPSKSFHPLARARRLRAKKAITSILLIILILQPNIALASVAGQKLAAGMVWNSIAELFVSEDAKAPELSTHESGEAVVDPLAPPVTSLTDAAISLDKPALNTGRIEGTLRVLRGETFSINGGFRLTSDLFLIGSPTIVLNAGAKHGGDVSDGGAASPANYKVTLNSNAVIEGKIHKQADPVQLPSDIPTSVPSPTGNRTVNINASSDLTKIGDWRTVQNLNVNLANAVIDVPPGNYGTITLNGGSRLNFNAGTYNFSNTINLNANSTIQVTGLVTINIGQALNINSGSLLPGNFTAPGDVRLNVLGSNLNLNNASQFSGLVRAINATVNLNGTSRVRGQLIAKTLNMNGGQITGAVWPAMTSGCLTVYGPRRFDRTTGQPDSYSEQFSLPGGATGPYTLHVQNGAAQNQDNRVSSARIKLNGAEILSPSDFNQNVGGIDRTVTPVATNTLDVSLASKPGSFLIITITTACLPADTTPPSVSIISPSDNARTQDEITIVTGSASDAGPNATGVASVTVNGIAAAFNAQTGTWTQSATPLAVGANTITVRAVDNAGNAAIQTITITRELALDMQPPILTITSPLDQSSSYESSVTVTGTAVDEGLNATGVLRVVVNGKEAIYDASSREWAASVPVNLGDNSITIVAIDRAPTPNQTQSQIRFTRLRISPPALILNSPQNGAFVSVQSMTVAGSVFSVKPDMQFEVTVNGQSATVSGNQFTSTVNLADGNNTITVIATDSLGQQAQSAISVISDRTPPTIALTDVPQAVEPGKSYLITAQANDAFGVARVDFLINGVRTATATAPPYQFTLGVDAQLAAGQVLNITAVAHDLADAISTASAQTVTTGPCGIFGHVLDDTTGYSLGNVMAVLNNAGPPSSSENGYFSLVSNVTFGMVRLSKDGYTPVERLYIVAPGRAARLFDARLTPFDRQTNLIAAQGGNATGDAGRLQVRFGANSFTTATDIRLTSISPQALINLLPVGWSPVPGAVIDVRSAASAQTIAPDRFATAAHLSILQTPGLAAGTPLVLARYDESKQKWIVVGRAISAGPNGALEADLPGLGQYAFLVADTGNTAPAIANIGEALISGPGADTAALNAATAFSVATPATSLYSESARSTVSFVAAPPVKLPSGIAIKAIFGESYRLPFDAEPLFVDRPSQDIILYSYPAASDQEPNRMGAFFVAKPTRNQLNLADIFNANVHVEVGSNRVASTGMLVDQGGGALRASNGAQLSIPANALPSTQPIFFDSVPVESVGVQIAEAELLTAFDFDLTGKTLSRSAVVSLPAVAGDASRLALVRIVTVNGKRMPEMVARVVEEGGRLTSTIGEPAVPSAARLQGVTTSGRYALIRLGYSFGYATGLVTSSADGRPANSVSVTADQAPFVDVTGDDGQFVIACKAGNDPAGLNKLNAASTVIDATGESTAALPEQDAVASVSIPIASLPLSVASISPADGAGNMIVSTPVTITFNKPVAAATLTGSTVKVSTAKGNPVLGTIALMPGNRIAVFTPSSALENSTTFRVSISQAVRDTYGKPLSASFNSTFSTTNVVKLADRLRPEHVRITTPDAAGMVRLTVAAGIIPKGSTVLIVNNNNGSTLSTQVGAVAFEQSIQARVGDEITLDVSQPDGTQYRVSQAAYRRADGTATVGANGGAVTSDDGRIILAIPPGAITGQADIKLSAVAESDITTPRQGDMDPQKVPFAAGVQITVSGNYISNTELHLELPAPQGLQQGQRVVFMKPIKISRGGVDRDAWEVLTSGKVEDGKLKTMSPPFYGLTLGSFVGNLYAYVFAPKQFRAVTGIVTEKVPGQAAKPLADVLVELTPDDQSGLVSVFARTGANGKFGTSDSRVTTVDAVQVTATDTLGRTQSAVATPYLNASPIQNPGLIGLSTTFVAIEFPSSAGLPETLPALLQLEGRTLDLQQDQTDTLQTAGRVLLGAHIEIKTKATPDVKQISGRVQFGGNTGKELIWTKQSPAAGSSTGPSEYVTDFVVDGEGSYSVVVVTRTQANVDSTKATATYNFVALANPNTRPPLDGPPRVLKVTPDEGAQQVGTATRVHIDFSEPVKNLMPGKTIYLEDVISRKKISGVITSGELPVEANTPNISSIDFRPDPALEANKKYIVTVTTDVKDSQNNPLDQVYIPPNDTTAIPFTSSFTTFSPLVLNDHPPQTSAYRVAVSGDLAITVEPSVLGGSFMRVFDVTEPEAPNLVGSQFVANYALAFDIAQAQRDSDVIKVDRPNKREYSTIAVVASNAPRDTSRPINLSIFDLDIPTQPSLIGVVSLNIPAGQPAYPTYIKIHHKRAYIGNLGSGALEVVDLEEAIRKLAIEGQLAFLSALAPNGGYDQEAKKQRVSYEPPLGAQAPVFSLAMIDQALPSASGAITSPVAYIASSKPQLISFDLNESYDTKTFLYDTDGDKLDDRILARVNLEPAGLVLDVRALSGVVLGGQSKDLAVLLGAQRMWFFDVTDPRAPKPFPSVSFEDLGLDQGYAIRMDVEDSLAYVMFSDKVAVIDFSNTQRPFLSATITNLGTSLRWVAVKEGFVYTLDPDSANPRVANLRTSIGDAAALVFVHGISRNTSQKNESVCANPVVLNRNDNTMVQDAETVFVVYGHDRPQKGRVIIRKETKIGDQTNTEMLANIAPSIDLTGSTNIVRGRARWSSKERINRAALYTAELILDEGLPTEFRSRRVEIPFSYLIDQYQEEFGISKGFGYLHYLLGGDSNVTLTVQDGSGAYQFVQLDQDTPSAPCATQNAGGSPSRSYGLHKDLLCRSNALLNVLLPGRYGFRLRADLKDTAGVNETVEGVITIDDTKPDKRQPGNIVVSNVELESGNLALTHTDIAEIHNRGLSLSFTRYYNSQGNGAFNPLGYGWRHNYQVLLTRDKFGEDFGSGNQTGPLYEITGGEGSGQTFREDELKARGVAQARAPYHGTLRKNPDGSFDYFTKAHIKYHFAQAIETDNDALFNQAYMGNLSYIEEPNGNKLVLAYDSLGRMASVADSSGRLLEFTYEQALTPLVGVIDTGNGLNQTVNCRSKRFLSSLRRRFLQANLGSAWRIIKIKGPGGLVVNYEYDSNSNLERITRVGTDDISKQTSDRIWQYAYDPTNGARPNLTHLLKSVKPPNHIVLKKNETTYEYELDQPGRPLKSINMPEDVSNRYSYTFTNGKITKAVVSDGRGNDTSYQFDAMESSDPAQPHKTVRVQAPRGARSLIVFDGYGNKLREEDAEGMVTEYSYDKFGNMATQIMRGADVFLTSSATFDEKFSKPLTITDANNHTTECTLDGRGNVTNIKLPTGRVMTIDYNSGGDVTRMVDQYGFVTTYPQYDKYGNSRKIQRQTSGNSMVETNYDYDERSRLKSISGTLEAITLIDYDALDRVERREVTDPTGFREKLVTTMEYLPEDQVKKMVQAGGDQSMQVVSEYDGLNRLSKMTEDIKDAGNFIRPFRYDKNSNLLEETDRRGVMTVRTYDELNFLKTVTLKGANGPDLKTLEQDPDLIGNPRSITNLYGQTDMLAYDGVHRLKVRREPGGYTEKYSYDNAGNVMTQEDRNGHITSFSYDPVNRVTEVRDALQRTITTTYDDATCTMTRVSVPQGLTEIMQEDGLGRPLKREVRFGDKDYITKFAYDGRKVTMTDPRGTEIVTEQSSFGEAGKMSVTGSDPPYSTEMRYSAMGGMKTRSDALRRTTTMTLDSLNRATKIEYPGGFKEQFTFDGEGLILSHTDRRNVVSKMTYDNLGRDLTMTVQDVPQPIKVQAISYDDANRTETRTDANNNSATLVYDGLHRLISMTNADGKRMAYEYDGINRTSESDFKGKKTIYTYDFVNRLKTIKDRKGQLTIITHDDTDGYTRKTTDRRGNDKVETYDQLGRLIKIVDGGEPWMSYEYDGNNNTTAMIDGLNNRTSYTYDKLNRVRLIDRAGLQTEVLTYDEVGNIVRHNDGRGPDMVMEYDDINHLKKQTNGAGNATLFTYDGEGLLLDRTDPKGAQYKTAYTYNALRSIKSVTDANSKTWNYEYDGVQNLKKVTDALGRAVTYEYDVLNRVKRITQPQNLITTYDYDENSNRISVTDPNGQVSTIAYDELDRPKTLDYTNVSGPGPRSFIYGHDPEGNLTNVSESTVLSGSTPVTRNYIRTYDKRNRAETTIDPFNHKVTLGHDAANNLTSITDGEGKQTSYTYDAHNRLKTAVLPNNGGTTKYTWYPDGLMQRVEYADGLMREYAYDDADRVQSITNTTGNNRKQEYIYTYDPNSNRKTEARNFEGSLYRSINYDYDQLDRLSKATYSTPNMNGLLIEYFGNSDLTNLKARGVEPQIDKTLPGTTPPAEGVSGESFSARWRGRIKPKFSDDYIFTVESDGGVRLYVNGQLVIDKWDKHQDQAVSEDSGTITLSASTEYAIKLEYRDDSGDAVVKLKWESARQTKEIISQDRFNLPAPDFNYTYDAVGNRKTETGTNIYGESFNRVYDYNDLDRLISITEGSLSTTCAYDNNGNLKERRQNGQVTQRFEYDVCDQLRSVFAANNQPIAQYDYDFQRHRLQRTANGGETLRYVYAGNRVVNEYKVTTGNVDRLFNRYDLGSNEVIRGEFANAGSCFYFSDALGSTTALTRFDEGVPAIAANYEYDAWGNYLAFNAGNANAIGYTGQRRDSETDLMPLGNGERYYSPGFGQFIQQDSFAGLLSVPASLNRHSYVSNNPMKYVDPSGHAAHLAATVGLGAALGALFGGLTEFGYQAVDVWNGKPGAGFDLGRIAIAAGKGAIVGAAVGLVIGTAGLAGGAVATYAGVAGGASAGVAAVETGAFIGFTAWGLGNAYVNYQAGNKGYAAVDVAVTVLSLGLAKYIAGKARPGTCVEDPEIIGAETPDTITESQVAGSKRLAEKTGLAEPVEKTLSTPDQETPIVRENLISREKLSALKEIGQQEWEAGLKNLREGEGRPYEILGMADEPPETGLAPKANTAVSKSGWKDRFPGIQVRKIGKYWVKRVNPEANPILQKWGASTIKQQATMLAKLKAAGRNPANAKLFASGRLIVEDVGPTLGRGEYFKPAFWRAYVQNAIAMRRPINDLLRPENYGQGYRPYDPAMDPYYLVIGGAVGLAVFIIISILIGW